MIKIKNSKVIIKGDLTEILTDYTVITEGMFDALTRDFDEDEVKDLLEMCFDRAFKSKEDLLDELARKLAKLFGIEEAEPDEEQEGEK